MRERLISEVKKCVLFCIPGVLYFVWVVLTDIYIPCPFKLLTGLKCPGCGITHMIMALFRLDFKEAFLSNPFLFVLLPLIIGVYIANRIYYIVKGEIRTCFKAECFFGCFLLVITLVYWIVRNLSF